jgi:hypothetical protein
VEDWVIDPAVPGPDVPPVGKSLFDRLVPGTPPFPFTSLLNEIESRVGGSVRYRRVLIPLGRSLQRSAAAPEFFTYPRAVAAFDAGPIKDRLFLGYQEKAGVVEVLSYNEEAGRFEFQLVSNYREGATPKVERASRKVCTVCHQNQAPVFSRQLWDETNSNPGVMKLLLREGKDFYGFPIQQSADVPYQIDNAIHRANEFSLYQMLWREAGTGVRASWLRAMLRCRLSGACDVTKEAGASPIAVWRKRWPRGLLIPNPEIPNRNPVAILSREGPPTHTETLAMLARRQKDIEPQFEPAVRRLPLETRHVDNELLQRTILGLASWFGESDVAALRKTKVDAAIDQWSTNPAGSPLASDVFRPEMIRKALLTH